MPICTSAVTGYTLLQIKRLELELGPVYMEIAWGPRVGEVTRLGGVTRLSI